MCVRGVLQGVALMNPDFHDALPHRLEHGMCALEKLLPFRDVVREATAGNREGAHSIQPEQIERRDRPRRRAEEDDMTAAADAGKGGLERAGAN